MDYLAKAEKISVRETAQMLEKQDQLTQQVQQLQSQLDWFKQQVFGQKSERLDVLAQQQLSLLNNQSKEKTKPVTETVTYTRKKGPKQRGDAVNDSGLRFDESVPVKEIRINAPELSGEDKEKYIVIDEKVVCRLAQRPASYVVLKYIQPVVKRQGANECVFS